MVVFFLIRKNRFPLLYKHLDLRNVSGEYSFVFLGLIQQKSTMRLCLSFEFVWVHVVLAMI